MEKRHKTVMDILAERRAQRATPKVLHSHPLRSRLPAEQVERLPPFLQEPAQPSKDMNEALRGMVDRPFLNSQPWQEQQWRANRQGGHPDLIGQYMALSGSRQGRLIKPGFMQVFQAKMRKLDIPMFAHCVVRTEQEQRDLFKKGVSRDSPDDGIWPHRGCAVDFVHSTLAWNLTEDQWLLIGHIGKQAADAAGIKVEWGGDWKKPGDKLGWDPAHWQLANWRMLMGGFPWTS